MLWWRLRSVATFTAGCVGPWLPAVTVGGVLCCTGVLVVGIAVGAYLAANNGHGVEEVPYQFDQGYDHKDKKKSRISATTKKKRVGSENSSMENADSVSDVRVDADLGRDGDDKSLNYQDDDNEERVRRWVDDAYPQRCQLRQRCGNLDKCSSISDESCHCGSGNPQQGDGMSGPPDFVNWMVDPHDPTSK